MADHSSGAKFEHEMLTVQNIAKQGDIKTVLDKLLEMEEKYSDLELKARSLYHLAEVFEQGGNIERGYNHFVETEKKYPPPNKWGVLAAVKTRAFYYEHPFAPPPPFLPQIQIEPTNACNMSCIMCPRKKMQRREAQILNALWQRVN